MSSDFSYRDYFRGGVVLGELLRSEEAPSWHSKVPHDVSKTKNLIYLGCNVFKTIHIVETLCKVLDHLAVDYRAVGGPAFCCGIVPRQKGEVRMGQSMYRRTATAFDKFEPNKIVHWCPSCEEEFEHSESLRQVAGQQIHFSEFLYNILRTRKLPHSVTRRVALHYHTGGERADRESNYALAILKLIPGLEVVPLVAPDAFGSHCSSQGAILKLGIDGYQHLVRQQFAELRQLRCDCIVTVYHSCHREYAKARQVGDPELINYVTLIAQSLGIDAPEDKFQRLCERHSLDWAMSELLPIAERRGIAKAAVEAVLKSQMALT